MIVFDDVGAVERVGGDGVCARRDWMADQKVRTSV